MSWFAEQRPQNPSIIQQALGKDCAGARPLLRSSTNRRPPSQSPDSAAFSLRALLQAVWKLHNIFFLSCSFYRICVDSASNAGRSWVCSLVITRWISACNSFLVKKKMRGGWRTTNISLDHRRAWYSTEHATIWGLWLEGNPRILGRVW